MHGVFIWHLGKNKNQKVPSGETDDFLTRAILYDSIEAQESTWTNSVLYIEPSDVLCQWYHTLLWNWLLQFMWRSLWIPMESLVTLPPPPHHPIRFYNYTSYWPKSGVIWGRSVLWCMSDLLVFSVALLSLGPLEGSLWNGSSWPWPVTVTYRGSRFLTHGCD